MASKWKGSGKIDGQLARKVVHIGIGLLVIFAPLLFSSNVIPTIIGLTFVFITFLTSPVSPIIEWRLAAFREGHGLGTVYYSVSLTSLLFLYFDKGWIIQVGFLPLVFGDAFANIVGNRFGNHQWFKMKKSIEGSIGGFIASSCILIISLLLYSLLGRFPGNFNNILVIAFLTSFLTMLTELISPFGLDNLTIPIISTIFALIYHNAIFMGSCIAIIC